MDKVIHLEGHRACNQATLDDFQGAVFFVDRYKSTYRGIPVRNLGSFGRRKFENLALTGLAERGVAKIFYQ